MTRTSDGYRSSEEVTGDRYDYMPTYIYACAPQDNVIIWNRVMNDDYFSIERHLTGYHHTPGATGSTVPSNARPGAYFGRWAALFRTVYKSGDHTYYNEDNSYNAYTHTDITRTNAIQPPHLYRSYMHVWRHQSGRKLYYSLFKKINDNFSGPCTQWLKNYNDTHINQSCLNEIWSDAGCNNEGGLVASNNTSINYTQAVASATGWADESSNNKKRICQGDPLECHDWLKNPNQTNLSQTCLDKLWTDTGCTNAGFYQSSTPRESQNIAQIQNDITNWHNGTSDNHVAGCHGVCEPWIRDANKTGVSQECINKVWTDKGCTTNAIHVASNMSNSTLNGIKSDMDRWKNGESNNMTTQCYGTNNECKPWENDPTLKGVSQACRDKLWNATGCIPGVYPYNHSYGSNLTLSGTQSDINIYANESTDSRKLLCRGGPIECHEWLKDPTKIGVSEACTNKLWEETGCLPGRYPRDNTFLALRNLEQVRSDVNAWADETTDARKLACRGGPLECHTWIKDPTLTSLSKACIDQIWEDKGCTGSAPHAATTVSTHGFASLTAAYDTWRTGENATKITQCYGTNKCGPWENDSTKIGVSQDCIDKLWTDSGCTASTHHRESNVSTHTLSEISTDIVRWVTGETANAVTQCYGSGNECKPWENDPTKTGLTQECIDKIWTDAGCTESTPYTAANLASHTFTSLQNAYDTWKTGENATKVTQCYGDEKCGPWENDSTLIGVTSDCANKLWEETGCVSGRYPYNHSYGPTLNLSQTQGDVNAWANETTDARKLACRGEPLECHTWLKDPTLTGVSQECINKLWNTVGCNGPVLHTASGMSSSNLAGIRTGMNIWADSNTGTTKHGQCYELPCSEWITDSTTNVPVPSNCINGLEDNIINKKKIAVYCETNPTNEICNQIYQKYPTEFTDSNNLKKINECKQNIELNGCTEIISNNKFQFIDEMETKCDANFDDTCNDYYNGLNNQSTTIPCDGESFENNITVENNNTDEHDEQMSYTFILIILFIIFTFSIIILFKNKKMFYNNKKNKLL